MLFAPLSLVFFLVSRIVGAYAWPLLSLIFFLVSRVARAYALVPVKLNLLPSEQSSRGLCFGPY